MMTHDEVKKHLKQCSKCKCWLPLALYSKSYNAVDWLQSYCRFCKNEANYTRNEVNRKGWIERLKRVHGINIVPGGEFHHREPEKKECYIGTFLSGSLSLTVKNIEKFDAEVRKCVYYNTPEEHGLAHRRLTKRKLNALLVSEMCKIYPF